MPVSKHGVNDAIFNAACERLDAQLAARTTEDEVTYFDIEGLPHEVQRRIREIYEPLGWTITYEYCPPDYEDMWFS